MLYQILSHTPVWVFGLFFVLLALGLKQTRDGAMGLPRIAVMPVAMAGLSLYGTVSAFGASAAVLAAWLLAAGISAATVLQIPLSEKVRFDAASRTLQMPGSWVPLALMMGIFSTKYFVGVVSAMHADFTANSSFALGFATLYGAFSGVFAGRALRLWKRVFASRLSAAAV